MRLKARPSAPISSSSRPDCHAHARDRLPRRARPRRQAVRSGATMRLAAHSASQTAAKQDQQRHHDIERGEGELDFGAVLARAADIRRPRPACRADAPAPADRPARHQQIGVDEGVELDERRDGVLVGLGQHDDDLVPLCASAICSRRHGPAVGHRCAAWRWQASVPVESTT